MNTPAEVVKGRTLTDYERDELLKYAACYECGGPRTASTTVTWLDRTVVPDVETTLRCMWCGTKVT